MDVDKVDPPFGQQAIEKGEGIEKPSQTPPCYPALGQEEVRSGRNASFDA
jgi:hypothetical protein